MEVGSEVKGFPKHVCEGLQVNNLNVGMVGTRAKKGEEKGQIICRHLVLMFIIRKS